VTPAVSVVMTAYNEASCVERAIQSILDQTLKSWELIFIDDGSTDGTVRVVEKFSDSRIRIVRHSRNIGMFEGRNEGIGAARGKYIAIFDADDLSHEKRLELQAAFLDAHPEIAACGTAGRVRGGLSEAVLFRQPTEPEEIRRVLLRTCPMIDSSLMVRSEIMKEFLYDASLRRGADYDLFLRLARKHSLANLPEPLLEFETSHDIGYRLKDQYWKFRVRWRALTRYGYSWKEAYWLLAFIPALLTPPALKYRLRRLWMS
jgi:glycosyltransferase involved in cell wall biosynthesis